MSRGGRELGNGLREATLRKAVSADGGGCHPDPKLMRNEWEVGVVPLTLNLFVRGSDGPDTSGAAASILPREDKPVCVGGEARGHAGAGISGMVLEEVGMAQAEGLEVWDWGLGGGGSA